MLHEFGLAFMAFFAIMNPISSLPVYLSLTESDNDKTAKKIARTGLTIAFLIIAVFSLGGQYIFSMFGITLPALRLTGGVLVFLIGFHMVQGKSSPMHKAIIDQNTTSTDLPANNSDSDDNAINEQARLNVAISPLGMPLLAGPGTIATAMSLSAHHNFFDSLVTILAFALLCLITYILFLYGKPLVKRLGDNAMNIMTRMMGLILAVIGTQMLIAGLQGAFKVLN